jgi:ankyrin repeat protein
MGDTPLHRAAAKNHVDMYHYLISRGADETMTNMAKETPRDVLKDIGRW